MDKKKKIIIVIITLLILTGIIIFIKRFSEQLIKVLTPLIMGVVIAYLLNPLVKWLDTKKVNRTLGILSIYAIIIIIVVTAVFFVVPEFIASTKEFITVLPDVVNNYSGKASRLLVLIEDGKWPQDLKNVISQELHGMYLEVQRVMVSALKKWLTTLAKAVTSFVDVILALIIAYYLIIDADNFKTSAIGIIPGKLRKDFALVGGEVNHIISSFIKGQLLAATIVGALESIGLYIVGVKYWLVLGLIGGIFNVIPYFGPIIGAIPATAVALIQSPTKALWTIAVFIITQQIDNVFISPKIIEGKLGLHPVTTILVILLGGEFFGIFGMLVAVPITAVIKIIMKRVVKAIV